MSQNFADVQAHGPLVPIFDDVWYVTGSVAFKPLLRLPRNMVVVRHQHELTLINAVRLDDKGKAELDALGKVTHVMRIGFHAMDDAYYLDQYGAKLWLVAGTQAQVSGAPIGELSETTTLPFPESRVFIFKETVRPEAAILIDRDGGLLITCDSVQHWVPSPLMSPMAKVVTRLIGFQKPAQIGPPWRKKQTPHGASLRPDFERLAALPFDQLIGGHGGLLEKAAASQLSISIDRELH
jgi:hypothetical protein